MTIGIVGVGNVGIKVAKVARELGMRVLLNDLPREEKEGSTNFCSLQFLAEECDVITFHVPLYMKGNIKLSIWPMKHSSVPSNVLPSSSILPAEK